MTDIQKELISFEVIKTLYNQFEKFPDDFSNNRNAPFHEAFLNAFEQRLEGMVQSQAVLISLASWMHGLSTSLGQSFLEKTAHILCDGEKREFTVKKGTSLKISKSQQTVISTIISSLTNGHTDPNTIQEEQSCYANNSLDIEATDFTADVYFEDDHQIICIEIKTVKPNKGVFKYEKEKVLEAKTALKNINPNKIIKYFLGFPFDPQSDTQTGFDKNRYSNYSVGFTKYFALDEFLLSSEMWDYLSSEQNTMETILEIINSIATPSFMDEYNFLQEKTNRNLQRYSEILLRWNLFTEIAIYNSVQAVNQRLINNKRLQRINNSPIFDDNGHYQEKRKDLLVLQ